MSARGVEAALLRLFWGKEKKRGREERQRRLEVQTKPKGDKKGTTADTLPAGGGSCNKRVKDRMSLLASCVHTNSHARQWKRERRSPEKRTGMVQQACSSLMTSRVAPLTHFLHHK